MLRSAAPSSSPPIPPYTSLGTRSIRKAGERPGMPDLRCDRCDHSADPGDRFCRRCGGSLAGSADYAEELHRTLVETIPVGVFTLEASGRVLFWNRAMEAHTALK